MQIPFPGIIDVNSHRESYSAVDQLLPRVLNELPQSRIEIQDEEEEAKEIIYDSELEFE